MLAKQEAEEKGLPPPKREQTAVEPPATIGYLLTYYRDIRAGMGHGMEVEPISHQEILAYRELHGLRERPDLPFEEQPEGPIGSWEVTALRLLDAQWFKAREGVKKPDPPAKPPHVGRG